MTPVAATMTRAGPHLDRPGRRARPRPSWAAVVAVGTLVALPLLAYGVPALLGYPVAPGDDFTQSLPLRELVGRDLAHGTLPLLDPYLWSGTPLLAGWNAGAAYPLTWLFAVLPAGTAWALGLAATGAVAGVGTYAFSRASGLGVVASWLGGFTFAFGGGMLAQVQHVGLVEGMSWVPLAALAVLRLTDPRATGRRAGWTAVLAASVGMVALSGEPRAVANAAVVLVVYSLWRIVRLWRAGDSFARGRTWAAASRGAAAVGGGAVLGLGIGALQLLPGLEAVAVSQRSAASALLFSAGSLPARWLLLFGVPDLLGGSGSFGQPLFFGRYNIAEVTGYAGVLALVAAGALVGRAVARRRDGLPDYAVWYLVGAAGIVLALGSNTPLWHLLVRIPFYGGQRLQSRNILVTDLALAMLLAHWADGWLGTGAGAAGPRRVSRLLTATRLLGGTRLPLAERVGGTVPALALGAVALGALVAPARVAQWMGASRAAAAGAGALRPWLVPFLVLAAGAVALLWGGSRITAAARRALVCGFVVTDLVVFAVLAVVAVAAPGTGSSALPPARGVAAVSGRAAASSRGATGSSRGTAGSSRGAPGGSRGGTARSRGGGRARPLASLGLDGRFAVYDPSLLHPNQLVALGVPDANAVTGTASVQGYGSIVEGRYAALTGVHAVSGHGQDVFSPAAARDGVLAQLDTTAVLAPATAFVHRAGRADGTRRVGTSGIPPARPGSPGDRRLATGARATWELGAPVSVRSLGVRAAAPGGHAGTRRAHDAIHGIRFGLVTPTGHIDWAPRTSRDGRSWHASWRSPVRAVAVVAAAEGAGHAGGGLLRTSAARDDAGHRLGRVRLGPPLLRTTSGRVVLDGVLQRAVVPPRWRYAGHDGAFGIFRDERAAPMLRLVGAAGAPLGGASVRRIAGPPLDPSAAVVRSAGGVGVVRAMAYLPGWRATWTPRAGRPVPLRVHQRGAVQVVRVPGGTGVLAWHYVTPGFAPGASIAAVSTLLAAALVVAAALRARDRRRPGVFARSAWARHAPGRPGEASRDAEAS